MSKSSSGNQPFDLDKLKELIEMMEESDISEIEIKEGEDAVRITRGGAVVPMPVPAPAAVAPAAAAVPAPAATETPVTEGGHLVRAPMVGTFYRAANPESPSFANVGDDVNPGKVVCIIEAMKLFNEIESEVKGKIVKVLVDNATPVEYDQPLFLVEPA